MEIDRTQCNNKILEVLRFFINICNENNLTYFVAYGSAIGAALYQGFIPWDDDIDVIMPRPDFERFKQFFQQRDMGKYEIVTPLNTPGYYMPFVKLCDKTTTILEQHRHHCLLGMCIDIFVIDGAKNDPKEMETIRKKMYKYRRILELSNTYYTLSDLFRMYIRKKRIRAVLGYLLFSLNRRKFSTLAATELEKLEKSYDYNHSEYVTNGYIIRPIYPKTWLEDKIMMPFETLQVAMPREYNQWLNLFYGDYTQLPPEDQRHTHFKAYCNLEKRENIDEVLQKVKKIR